MRSKYRFCSLSVVYSAHCSANRPNSQSFNCLKATADCVAGLLCASTPSSSLCSLLFASPSSNSLSFSFSSSSRLRRRCSCAMPQYLLDVANKFLRSTRVIVGRFSLSIKNVGGSPSGMLPFLTQRIILEFRPLLKSPWNLLTSSVELYLESTKSSDSR